MYKMKVILVISIHVSLLLTSSVASSFVAISSYRGRTITKIAIDNLRTRGGDFSEDSSNSNNSQYQEIQEKKESEAHNEKNISTKNDNEINQSIQSYESSSPLSSTFRNENSQSSQTLVVGSATSINEEPSPALGENAEETSQYNGATQENTSLSAPHTLSLGPNAPPPGLIRRNFPHLPWHKLPNYLTYARCFAIPLMLALFYAPNRHLETAGLFAVASFTDWLDGFLARRWDISTPFGAFLDPVADKLMVSTALVLLAGRFGASVAIPTSVILAREISVSALREWMATQGLRDIVKVGFQGKAKTAMTMLAVNLLLLVPGDKVGVLAKLYEPAVLALYLSAGITLTSGSVYFRAAAPFLMPRNND